MGRPQSLRGWSKYENHQDGELIYLTGRRLEQIKKHHRQAGDFQSSFHKPKILIKRRVETESEQH